MLQKWEYHTIEQTRELKSKMTRYEYGTFQPEIDLNALGEKGWELVNVVPIMEELGFAGVTKRLRYTFKRPA